MECGHRFVLSEDSAGHVARIYGDHYFFGDSAGYPDYLEENELLVSHGRRYARMMDKYTKPGRLLDVGAAAGFVMKGFMEMGWKGVGIEPNPGMAEHARKSLGLDVRVCTLEDFEPTGQFDLVSMIQVVPHFVDPRRALASAARLTKEGGYWLIETWDCQSWTARCVGKAWHEYSPPSVLHWFSQIGLAQLVGEFGFSELAHGQPRKWIRGSHAKAVMRASGGARGLWKMVSGLAGMIPDHMALPYLGDDLYWTLFQRGGNGTATRWIKGRER
jgi:SAM-dependent methyltransferase